MDKIKEKRDLLTPKEREVEIFTLGFAVEFFQDALKKALDNNTANNPANNPVENMKTLILLKISSMELSSIYAMSKCTNNKIFSDLRDFEEQGYIEDSEFKNSIHELLRKEAKFCYYEEIKNGVDPYEVQWPFALSYGIYYELIPTEGLEDIFEIGDSIDSFVDAYPPKKVFDEVYSTLLPGD